MVAPMRLSIMRPHLRELKPMPPPKVSPAMPTDGHEPVGNATPSRKSAKFASTLRAPAAMSAVIVGLSITVLAMPSNEMTRPSVVDCPM